MSQTETFMDIPQVTKLANQFGTYGETLQNVSKVLEATIIVLRAAAFVGVVGLDMVRCYMDVIKPRIDTTALKMFELQKDVLGAISYVEGKDVDGSARFR